ncbi:tRNA dihydrouridine synthase DusB [candidate division KSB1 bacterium]|nr:tRNA dihydrouridine synthase DusB [candidate division KSB1 bacterium]
MNIHQQLEKNPTLLAPLAGWSDSIFRRICKRAGAGWVFTEMVSSDGVFRQQKKTLDYVGFSNAERPISIQIYGAHPEVMARAAERLAVFQPDGLDLNFGCPVKKVVRTGGGAALLRDPERMCQIVRAVIGVTDIPVTAKIRSGWAEDRAVELALALEESGIQALIVHGRTRQMQFRGTADWESIARVKSALTIPVIGNGDIRCAEDAERMMRETGCDGVMIGRGAQGNPWIFSQIRARMAGLPVPPPPSLTEIEETLLEHAQLLVMRDGELRAMYQMRKHLVCYLRGKPLFNHFRQALVTSTSLQELRTNLSAYAKAREQAVQNGGTVSE